MNWDEARETLRAEREYQNLSQSEVATLMAPDGSGSSRNITAWETGMHQPSVRSLYKWANALGLEVEISFRGHKS